jgi:hypothetical protein
MFRLLDGNKTIATNENAFALLENATNYHEKKSRAAVLTWCGTDKAFFEEVTTFAPTSELAKNTWIIGDGDYFAPINEDANLQEINNALHDIHSSLRITEDEETED